MTTTFEDIEIHLPYPAYSSDGLRAVVDMAEEYMQGSVVLFASGYEGGQPDMITWLAENGLLSEKGLELTEDGAQKLDPGSSAMVDDYDDKLGEILDEASRLRLQNDNVNESAFASFDTANQAFQNVMETVDQLETELSRAPGQHQLTRDTDGTLRLTVAEETRLLRLILEAVDSVHDTLEDASSGMRRNADDVNEMIPGLPRNPHGNAPDVGPLSPWTPTPEKLKASWKRGNGTPEDIVALAVDQVGKNVSERNGNNIPTYPNGEPAPYNIENAWCAAFATWVWDQAGYDITWTNKDYVPAIWADAKKLGWRRKQISDTQKGDMIIFDWQGDGTPDHVGIVEAVDPVTGRIHTIEGNSGDRLRRRSYPPNAGSLVGSIRPPNAADSPAAVAV